ncbi:MAG: histidine kinase [Cytophagales bacterium]|nr:histidine kinase [Cytophagales bacterium]
MFQEKYRWSWGRLAVILASSGLICIIFPFNSPTNPCPWWQSYIIYIFYTFSLWEGCLYILLKIRELYPKIEQTRTRISLIYTIVMIYVTIMVAVLTLIICHLRSLNFLLEDYWFSLKISLVVTLLIFSIYEAVYFFGKWRDVAVEAEKLKQENTTAQLEGLKNQVNPHFLFNSLNTLSTLIMENPPLAVDFVQKLAEVYHIVLKE